MTEWINMSACGLLFERNITVNIPLDVLVKYRTYIISPRSKETMLLLNEKQKH